MKVSLNWLTDYVDISMPVAELGDLLTRIGLGVEDVIETDTDVVLDLEVTSNRPDWLGHLGVAREIAAATQTAFRPPTIGEAAVSGRMEDLACVEVLDADLCPRYTARVLRGVKVAPSPKWLVDRLEAVGLRSVNNVVDVTNYVLMEYSQPLHAFDYDKLAGHKIIVRRARRGETMVSIDRSLCRLDEEMLVIADAERAVAIAGVMGGLDTEVGPATTNVLIESARFDPLATRRTSRRLQLMSESNYRFERGVDPVAVDAASLRACQLILDLGGGRLAEGVLDVWAEPYRPRRVTLRPQRCNALLGVDTPAERQAEILARLGLEPKMTNGRIECTVPSHRGDVNQEVDLIEEVARLGGYDRIAVLDKVTHEVTGEGRTERTRRMIGGLMTAAGFDETVTNSFLDAGESELFGWTETVRVDATVRKTNNVLRPTLLASLLRACKTNQDAGNAEMSFFELAGVFPPAEGRSIPAEHVELAMVTTRELRDLRGALESVLAGVAPRSRLAVRPRKLPGLADDMSAEVLVDEAPAGVMGAISAEVLEYYGLNADRAIAAAAIRFDALLERAGRRRTYQPVAKFPAVRRDLSLVVDEQVAWAALAEAIERVDQPARVGLDYVTTYRGRQIPPGRKSVTLTLTYRHEAQTLRSEEVDQQVDQVVSALRETFAVELRG